MRLSKAGRVLLGAGAATVLALAGTGIAAAGSHGSRQPPGPVVHTPKLVSTASLCTALFAVVNSDGSLARSGCPGTGSFELGTNSYQVDFPRNITACAFVGTIGNSDSLSAPPAGMITVVGRSGDPNGVFVQTFNAAGAATPLGFHLAIHCPNLQRSGKVTILAGNTTAGLSVPGGISNNSVGQATVQNNAGVNVQYVQTNVSQGTITIHLNKASTKNAIVGWSVADSP